MIKILNGKDVKSLDQKYIQEEGISSFDLMERAAEGFVEWYISRFDEENALSIYSGTGNNGGDGLAIARLLKSKGYNVTIYVFGNVNKASADFKKNFDILTHNLPVIQLSETKDFICKTGIIVDALFGVGINRALEGQYLKLVDFLNKTDAVRIAIDLPSGLPSDSILQGEAIKAKHTVTFQFPKLSLLLPEHAAFSGNVHVVDIGIPDSYLSGFVSNKYFLQRQDILSRHIFFHSFSHKGDFGRVLLVGGSIGKIGAMALSSNAALRTGSGLVSCYIPQCGVAVLQTALPEVMIQHSGEVNLLDDTNLRNQDLNQYDAIGIGPGMGTGPGAKSVLEYILRNFDNRMVLDADALNILSENKEFLEYLGSNRILTPHIKEFERLTGKTENHLERIQKAGEFSVKHQCILVLKGANTIVSLPDGNQIFNSTGTQYMATAGSGDVLTGVITSFLGQGYTPENAALCGVFHHGLAGEIASRSKLRGTVASDILQHIPDTFVELGIF